MRITTRHFIQNVKKQKFMANDFWMLLLSFFFLSSVCTAVSLCDGWVQRWYHSHAKEWKWHIFMRLNSPLSSSFDSGGWKNVYFRRCWNGVTPIYLPLGFLFWLYRRLYHVIRWLSRMKAKARNGDGDEGWNKGDKKHGVAALHIVTTAESLR